MSPQSATNALVHRLADLYNRLTGLRVPYVPPSGRNKLNERTAAYLAESLERGYFLRPYAMLTPYLATPVTIYAELSFISDQPMEKTGAGITVMHAATREHITATPAIVTSPRGYTVSYTVSPNMAYQVVLSPILGARPLTGSLMIDGALVVMPPALRRSLTIPVNVLNMSSTLTYTTVEGLEITILLTPTASR